jgi:hypothetical protein
MMTNRTGRSRSVRVLARVLLVGLLSSVAAIGLAGPAAAHNVLISSDPPDGAVLPASPATVTLTFDQPVQNFEPVVTVLGADGQRYESGPPQVDSTQVSTAVGALPGSGDYTIAYRVVSADGHPVQGEIRFRLDAPASPGATSGAGSGTSGPTSAPSAARSTALTAAPTTAAPTTAPTTTAAVTPTSSSSGLSGWVWAAIALAAVLVVAAVLVILRRPRPDQR